MRTGVVDAVDKALKPEEFGHRPGALGGDLQVLWQQGAAEFDATDVALVVYDHPLPDTRKQPSWWIAAALGVGMEFTVKPKRYCARDTAFVFFLKRTTLTSRSY